MPTRCSDQLELQRNFKQSSFIILSSFFALPGTVGLTLSRMCYRQQQPCLCCSKPMLSVHFCFKVVESEKFHQQQLRNNKENGLPATTLFVSAQKECFFYLLPGGNFPISVLPILKKGNLFLATTRGWPKTQLMMKSSTNIQIPMSHLCSYKTFSSCFHSFLELLNSNRQHRQYRIET